MAPWGVWYSRMKTSGADEAGAIVGRHCFQTVSHFLSKNQTKNHQTENQFVQTVQMFGDFGGPMMLMRRHLHLVCRHHALLAMGRCATSLQHFFYFRLTRQNRQRFFLKPQMFLDLHLVQTIFLVKLKIQDTAKIVQNFILLC